MDIVSLQDKQIIIIGGSSGIGFATAKLCLSPGATVTIAGRTEKRLESASEELHGKVKPSIADITDANSLVKLFADYERIDHVFMSAGYPVWGSIAGSDIADLSRAIQQHIWAPIHIARNIITKMNADSSIILMSGLYSSRPSRDAPMTTVAFAGLEMLTCILALELEPIRVNAIAPGIIDTAILGEDKSGALAYAETLPVKRMGQAEEVAEALVMLMNNDFITGEVLHIDGGGRFI